MVEAMEHQTPSCMTSLMETMPPAYQGSGKGEKASDVIATIAARISVML